MTSSCRQQTFLLSRLILQVLLLLHEIFQVGTVLFHILCRIQTCRRMKLTCCCRLQLNKSVDSRRRKHQALERNPRDEPNGNEENICQGKLFHFV